MFFCCGEEDVSDGGYVLQHTTYTVSLMNPAESSRLSRRGGVGLAESGDPDDDQDGGYVPSLEGNMMYQHEVPRHL